MDTYSTKLIWIRPLRLINISQYILPKDRQLFDGCWWWLR